MFHPLTCNENLTTSTTTCIPWTKMFTNKTIHTNEIIIPCGKCVIMDYFDDAAAISNNNNKIYFLNLTKGLDIQGKLVFPYYKSNSNSNNTIIIIIETPYVYIQGELQMSSKKIVNGKPTIKIILTGTAAIM